MDPRSFLGPSFLGEDAAASPFNFDASPGFGDDGEAQGLNSVAPDDHTERDAEEEKDELASRQEEDDEPAEQEEERPRKTMYVDVILSVTCDGLDL